MDTIFLMPNHAETISTSTEARISVAGIMVIGLGAGETRPTFTFDTAVGSGLSITGHSVFIENLLLKAGIDQLTDAIHISSSDVTLKDIEWRDNKALTYECADIIVATSDAQGLVIDGFQYKHYTSPGGGTQNQSVIQCTHTDRVTIRNCWLVGRSAAGILEATSTLEHWFVHDNYFANPSSNLAVAISSTGSGAFLRNLIAVTSCEAGVFISPSTHPMMVFESYGCGSVSHSAIVAGNALAAT